MGQFPKDVAKGNAYVLYAYNSIRGKDGCRTIVVTRGVEHTCAFSDSKTDMKILGFNL